MIVLFCGRDYPRSRGGTNSEQSKSRRLPGLSPLARGNLYAKKIQLTSQGTIPARAGEPNAGFAGAGEAGDYPRSRGGTGIDIKVDNIPWGLSPLARGNH